MLKPRRRYGQNFLIDRNICEKIVESISAADTDRVIEIGPGTGALTGLLSDRFRNFVAVEVDERAVDLLREQLPQLQVVHKDILECQWSDLTNGEATYVVGNLPYNITSPILFGMIDQNAPIAQATIMVQLEVARRMTAKPNTKDYGILSVATQLAGDVRMLFKVSKNVFRPVPDVESAIVQINFNSEGYRADPFLRRIIRTAFNQRRKTLRNSLKSICNEHGKTLEEGLGWRRPEDLTPEEFVALADFFKDR